MTTKAQIESVSDNNTTAIIKRDGSIYASGSLKAMTKKWASLPFDTISDIYVFAIKAIDGKYAAKQI